MSQILNSSQVAEMLGCTPRTVEDHARAGTLKGTKFGEGWIFLSDMVIEDIRIKCETEAMEKRKPPKVMASLVHLPVKNNRRRELPNLMN